MGEGARRRRLLADACYLAGGAALVASAFVHWIARGAGSNLRGHALVDALVGLGRRVPALSAGRLTVIWYLVPALGAVSWIVYGVWGRARAAQVVATAALVVTAVAAIAFRDLAGTARLGWGPKVALAGGVLLVAGAWAPDLTVALSTRRRRRRVRSPATGP